MSSLADGLVDRYAAGNPIGYGGEMAHTKKGKGQWWRADFQNGDKLVVEVDIQNIPSYWECCGERLQETKVMIGEQECGYLP